MNLSLSLIEGLLLLSVGGLVSWVWYLQIELNKTKLDLAKNYHSKEELRLAVDSAVSPLRADVNRLSIAFDRLYEKLNG